MPPSVVQSRSWCYTLNNPSDDEKSRLVALEVVVHVAGLEVGESGTPHVQGYVRFAQNTKLSWWKNQFPRAHVERRAGTEAQAIAYCKKDNDMLVEVQPDPTHKRSSMGRYEYAEHVCELLEQGKSIHEIYKRHKGFYFYNRRAILQVKEDISRWKSNPDYEPTAENPR